MKYGNSQRKCPSRTGIAHTKLARAAAFTGLALFAGAIGAVAPQAWGVVTESATRETPTAATDPRGLVNSSKTGTSSRFIVRFHASPSLIDRSPGAASTRRSERTRLSADLAARGTHGKHVKREFHRVYNGVAIEAAAEDIDFIRSLSYVADIQPDVDVHTALATSVPDIGATAAWTSYGVTGSGVRVAILDTGVDYTHSDLGGCFGPSCKVIGGYDFVNDDDDPADDNGHGTHVAGIVAANGSLKGVAPDASILAYKVLDASGSGWSSDSSPR